jgi:hypothetical protein
VRRAGSFASLALAMPLAAIGDDPPVLEHQPIPCTIPGKAISICASISDDAMVAKARAYFRRADEKFYNWVEMSFGGINYCATLPAPRGDKAKTIEYYLQATDDQFQSQRTSTYQMAVQAEGVCEFPPLEKDAAKAASIKVYATNPKQGKKLDDAFEISGVTFVPFVGR